MKTTAYLQFILTIIAINLTLLSLKEFEVIPTAQAHDVSLNTPANKEVTDVNIVSIDGRNIFNGTLPIQIKEVYSGQKLPVEVVGWDTYDQPQVEIKKWSTYDKVPVEVKNSYIYTKDY